ncbi:MAG TPA: radical SAM protein, partial [Polyangiaceae bacterium]|nr:radical SAM protein [Polyangiaceae bacterium]
DSIVLYDGEETFPELLAALERDTPLADVPGLAYRDDDGVHRTPGRALCKDLDALPFPTRYRAPSRHAGVPFVPIMGSRGCWGSCSYCSITSFYRDAKRDGGGALLRLRSPENVADEMAALSLALEQPCVFCFHDDNFLLPNPADSLQRVEAICLRLAEHGVEKAGFIGKCRPETVTPELLLRLRELGVVRMYVGVENVAEAGSSHLNRGVQHEAVGRALEACDVAGIFACYNLLVFEPKATLADLRENIAFMRAHPKQPVNFCRAEPYYGTPLQLQLAEVGKIGGSYLGWNYRIDDDRTELCFRIAASVFRERNFRCDGVANRYMGVGYAAKLIEHFRPDAAGSHRRLLARAEALTRAITLDTAELFERVVDLAERSDLSDFDQIERQTALLGLEVAESDRIWQHELDGFYAEIDRYTLSQRKPRPVQRSRPKQSFVRNVVFGASLALTPLGCGDTETSVDPLPSDGGMDAGDSGGDAQPDQMVADPLPMDAGFEADSFVADPPPADAGVEADSFVADPPPPDGGFSLNDENPQRKLKLIDQWVDTGVRRAKRSQDLPLFDPPDIELAATTVDGVVRARLLGVPDGATTRWETRGEIAGEGLEVQWTPALAEDDALKVAVRSRGGISFATLRAKAVRESEG